MTLVLAVRAKSIKNVVALSNKISIIFNSFMRGLRK